MEYEWKSEEDEDNKDVLELAMQIAEKNGVNPSDMELSEGLLGGGKVSVRNRSVKPFEEAMKEAKKAIVNKNRKMEIRKRTRKGEDLEEVR